jgi:hypothetical protein
MEDEFIQVNFKKPIKPSLSILLFLGYRKGNKVLMAKNKITGVVIHKQDWFELQELVKRYGVDEKKY